MIASEPIEEFMDEVRARVPLAGEPDIAAALRDAARILCRRVKLWRETRDLAVTHPAGQALWDDDESRIALIETARMGGRGLELRTPDWLDLEHPTWQDAPGPSGPARYVTQLVSGEVVIWPAEAGTVRMRMVLIPSRQCATLPRFLFDDHMETLGLGAAARVLMLPNPDFANPAYGAALDAQFRDEVDRLATSAARLQIRAPRRSRAVWF
ncbi:hypothetical protein [Microcystis phage Mwe-JY25]